MITIDDIKKELSKYDFKIIEHFESTFPCENLDAKEVEIFEDYYYDYIDKLSLKIDDNVGEIKSLILSEFKPFGDGVFVSYESPDELWKRWNKYLKLRIFL